MKSVLSWKYCLEARRGAQSREGVSGHSESQAQRVSIVFATALQAPTRVVAIAAAEAAADTTGSDAPAKSGDGDDGVDSWA
jgi:hypothetical protein